MELEQGGDVIDGGARVESGAEEVATVHGQVFETCNKRHLVIDEMLPNLTKYLTKFIISLCDCVGSNSMSLLAGFVAREKLPEQLCWTWDCLGVLPQFLCNICLCQQLQHRNGKAVRSTATRGHWMYPLQFVWSHLNERKH